MLSTENHVLKMKVYTPDGVENALNNRRTRIKHRLKRCFRLPFVASRATKWQSKTLFLTFVYTFANIQ